MGDKKPNLPGELWYQLRNQAGWPPMVLGPKEEWIDLEETRDGWESWTSSSVGKNDQKVWQPKEGPRGGFLSQWRYRVRNLESGRWEWAIKQTCLDQTWKQMGWGWPGLRAVFFNATCYMWFILQVCQFNSKNWTGVVTYWTTDNARNVPTGTFSLPIFT